MRDIAVKSLAIITVGLFVLSGQDLMAQKKSKSGHHVLNGTQVYVHPDRKAVPVEEKLKANSEIAIDYAPSKTIYLYPEGQNVNQGIEEDGIDVTEGPLESNEVSSPEKAESWGFMTDVSDSARIDIYLPKQPNGLMVIACPGGSYYDLSTWNEGSYVAKWMNDRGIACAVVKYRLPNGHWRVPLQDVQNAFRYCRFHSKDWGVSQIGVIGFSAGGHLASTVATMYVDEITKPDFAILIYPVISFSEGITHKGTKDNLIGEHPYMIDRDAMTFDEWYDYREQNQALATKYSTYLNVTQETPPTFIAASTNDDLVPIENSLRFYSSLVRMRIPVELQIYPLGGHGWGFTTPEIGLDANKFKDNLGSCRPEFSAALGNWLNLRLKDKTKLFLDAQEEEKQRFSLEPDSTILLYPKGQNVDEGIAGITLGPGESNGYDRPEEIDPKNEHHSFTGDSVRFDLYFAKNPNGKMVIVTPGGGYAITSGLTEGKMVAKWLNDRGISAAVLNYRLPNGHWNVPLRDVQNTFRYCRHYAKQWGMTKIGIMGFSAGGHLAATASTLYVDPVTRPDFSVLVYPVISSEKGVAHEGSFQNLLGDSKKWNSRKASSDSTASSYEEWGSRKEAYKKLLERYSLDKQVTPDTPPTFIVFSSNDEGVPPENEILYYRALVRNNVRCEMHAFPDGGHGYGFIENKYQADPLLLYRTDFFNSMERFLKEI
jgi:acetyl esterase/lipase